jgi:hypothetical protein
MELKVGMKLNDGMNDYTINSITDYIIHVVSKTGTDYCISMTTLLDNVTNGQWKLLDFEPNITKQSACTCGMHTTYGVNCPMPFHSNWCDLLTAKHN